MKKGRLRELHIILHQGTSLYTREGGDKLLRDFLHTLWTMPPFSGHVTHVPPNVQCHSFRRTDLRSWKLGPGRGVGGLGLAEAKGSSASPPFVVKAVTALPF